MQNLKAEAKAVSDSLFVLLLLCSMMWIQDQSNFDVNLFGHFLSNDLLANDVWAVLGTNVPSFNKISC